jgi:CHAT domain-containing protein/Flp pilus assembly protein TadD
MLKPRRQQTQSNMGSILSFARHFTRHETTVWARLGLLALTLFFVPVFAPTGRANQTTADPRRAARNLCNADGLLADATRLRDTWQVANLKQAIATYEQALSCARFSGSLLAQAQALRGIGNIQYLLGDRAGAVHNYEKALQNYVSGRDRTGETLTLVDLSSAYSRGLSGEKSRNYSLRALAIAREVSDKHLLGPALDSLGYAYYVLAEVTVAQKHFTEALTYARSDNDPALQADITVHLAYTYADTGELKEALAAYEQAVSLCHTKQPWVEARALSGIGGVYTLWGENQKALEYHQSALDLQQSVGDREGQAVTLNGIGYSCEQLGDLEKALNAYSKALDLFREAGNADGQAFTVQYVGNIHARLGRNAAAENCYLEGLAASRKVPDTVAEGYALNNLGAVYQAAGETKRALDHYRQAFALCQKTRNRRGSAYALNNIGYALASVGKFDRALSYHRKALGLIRASGDRQEESLILYDIARAQSRGDKLEEARAGLEEATNIAESLRTNVVSQDFRASYFSTVRPQYELYIQVLMQLHKQQGRADFEAEAFSVSERAHARSLLESLREARADIRQGVDPKLLEAERSLRQALASKAERYIQLRAADNEHEAQATEKEIDEITSQYDQLKTRIKIASPRYAALIQPQPSTLREIQDQVLDDDSLLLEYTLADDRSYLWAVTRKSVSSYELPGRAVIEEATRNVHALLIASQPLQGETFEQRQTRVVKANEELPTRIASLSKILVAPVAEKLGKKRLLIVPDGALQYIPFQILNTGNDQRPLVVDHEIVNEPSASALALLVAETKNRKAAPNSVAVLADPVFESDDPRITSAAKPAVTSGTGHIKETEFHQALRDVNLSGNGHIPRLLASRDEAEAIMSVAPWRSGFVAMNFEASRATVMKTDLSTYRIVHFATHGLVNNEHPELSGIVLSLFDQKGQPQDGYLRLHDIYNLKLPVDLVVLSACNTGLGKDVKGEGLIGLTRGFMYAGASSVVASLWKVDDEATSELMRHFYGYMLRDGLSPAAALRKAQVTMSQQKRWQSPYYWAGFVIQGQYLPAERVRSFSNRRIALWLITAAIVSAVTFYALKRRRKIIL